MWGRSSRCCSCLVRPRITVRHASRTPERTTRDFPSRFVPNHLKGRQGCSTDLIGYTLTRPDWLHIGNVQGCWDGRRPPGGGHPSSRVISPECAPRSSGAYGSRTPGIAASTYGPLGGRSRRCGSIPPCPRCLPLMTFLAPSTGPVSFQCILEVLPISLDKCVTHQPGSYKAPGSPLPSNPSHNRPNPAGTQGCEWQ